TPINAASVISVVAMIPKEATPWSSPRGGPPSARTRQLRPPTARSPCRAASDHGGVPGSVCKCRTASTEPNKTATPRMTKAAINMTRHSTAQLHVHACVVSRCLLLGVKRTLVYAQADPVTGGYALH